MGEELILKFYNYIENDFKFSLTREVGFADIYVTICPLDFDIDTCIENLDKDPMISTHAAG